MSLEEFGSALKAGDIAEVVMVRPKEEINSSLLLDEAVLEVIKRVLNARSGSSILRNALDPYYPLVKKFQNVVSKDPRSVLPPDRGVRHEIDLDLGTKYCVTRQWPLPKEQCDVIDAFFRAKHDAGMVRESESPHSTPTFCVRKPNDKSRIVHAYNKLNAATIPAQMPIPGKDVLQNNMLQSKTMTITCGFPLTACPVFSDRNVSLVSVAESLGIFYMFCVRHIIGNTRANKTVRLTVTQEQFVWEENAAVSYVDYDVAIGKLNDVNPAATIYLSAIPASKWTLHPHVTTTPLYGWRTTNFVESEQANSLRL
ncbi:reverse transcriptase [Plasmopara halstedii]|uniref:Reverse transcriptase n=1 Tax=Plasmopara halstedii TaxID=4781 RepID=A0A0P1AFH5_PLAHL|nr:reverse transcriptase [Plasmopara halstedii]CEG39276.1 reverse transcriptase [Plasmopara halstedii]|eukprot:XP_024575645.1 reverse transcriptase [Plasmopara halstedii]